MSFKIRAFQFLSCHIPSIQTEKIGVLPDQHDGCNHQRYENPELYSHLEVLYAGSVPIGPKTTSWRV